jgi:hypothetical protein
MTFKLNPAKPAVTKVVEAAQPPSVTVTVSLHEALLIAAMQGLCNGSHPSMFYQHLRHHDLFEAYVKVMRAAINVQGCINLHAHPAALQKLQDKVEAA